VAPEEEQAAVDPARPAVGRSPLLDRLKRADPNWWLVAALVGTFVIVYAPLVYRRHANFASFSWDMGIFDQAVWLLSRGRSFITVRGLDFFGHHASYGLFLFVPFYWLGAGVQFLNLVQVLSLALGAVPVFLISRDRVGRGWIPLALAAVYLLHPALGFVSWELFHPEVMAITPLLFAWWFAGRQRWGWFAVSVIYAVSWKEDVALAAMVLGLILAVRGRAKERRVGIITAVAALAWFVVVTRVLLPAIAGEAFYGQLYKGIGSTPGNIVSGAVDDPGNITSRLANDEARTYLWQLLVPFGFIPALAPASLIAVPQLLANLLSDYVWTRQITFHYVAVPIAALTLGAVEGVAWLGRRLGATPALVAAMLVCALVGAVQWGVSPIGREYDSGYWGYETVGLDAKREAIAMIPPGEPTSASYFLVPHLTHRPQLYEYPNPFRSSGWGIRDRDPHDPADVKWIVIDRQSLGAEDSSMFDALVASGEFRVRFSEADVIVAERVRLTKG